MLIALAKFHTSMTFNKVNTVLGNYVQDPENMCGSQQALAVDH